MAQAEGLSYSHPSSMLHHAPALYCPSPVKRAQESLDDEDSSTAASSQKINDAQVVSSVLLSRPDCICAHRQTQLCARNNGEWFEQRQRVDSVCNIQ